jgi:hypothetical protein
MIKKKNINEGYEVAPDIPVHVTYIVRYSTWFEIY